MFVTGERGIVEFYLDPVCLVVHDRVHDRSAATVVMLLTTERSKRAFSQVERFHGEERIVLHEKIFHLHGVFRNHLGDGIATSLHGCPDRGPAQPVVVCPRAVFDVHYKQGPVIVVNVERKDE